jgi:cation diffusion facilitator family transporter
MDTSTKQGVALSSIFASAGLTAAKLVVGVLTGSLGILSEAAHSLLDLGAASITWMAVRVSDKPADADHPWGHGKFEAVSALIETGLLFVTSFWIAKEAIARLISGGSHVEVTWYSIAVVVGSIVVDFTRSRALMKVARETKSQALEADALHFSSDILSSAAVLVGLGGVAFGFQKSDSIAALLVSLVVAKAGWDLGKRTVDVLVDAAPAGLAESIAEVLAAIPGIARADRIRARIAGSTVVAEALVSVVPGTPIERASALCAEAEAAVVARHPEVAITVRAEPLPLDQASVGETVRHAAARLGLDVHDVAVHSARRRDDDGPAGLLHVVYDVEIDSGTLLRDAHARADALERAVAAQLGDGVVVRSHLDPKRAGPIDAKALPAEIAADLTARVAAVASSVPLCRDVRDTLVQDSDDGICISISCLFDPALPLHDVHAATLAVEHRIRRFLPSAGRVLVHAEPAAEATAKDEAATAPHAELAVIPPADLAVMPSAELSIVPPAEMKAGS